MCRVWSLDVAKTPATRATLVDNPWRCSPTGGAEDASGELYVLALDRIMKLARDASRDALPRRLSETTLR